MMIYPKTYQAAKKYGYNTKWCVTSSSGHFNSYKKSLVYVIMKPKEGKNYDRFKKIALHRSSNSYISVYDEQDASYGTSALTNAFGEDLGTEMHKYYRACMKRNTFWARVSPWSIRYKLKIND